ncbi:MAG: cytochrome b5 domain-containing protein [Halanaerobiales bacterium]
MNDTHRKNILLAFLLVGILIFSPHTLAAEENRQCFTPDILAEFDGQDDTPGYIALDGRVYDISKIWKDGTHAGHEAGNDITDAFPESPHDDEKLQETPVIGVMVEKTFTADELAKYYGKDGEKGYVAVNGIVYDITEIWKDGSHAGHEAGNDITEAAYEAPHGLKPLAKAPIVGIMK